MGDGRLDEWLSTPRVHCTGLQGPHETETAKDGAFNPPCSCLYAQSLLASVR